MPEPIKIILTAETEKAAADLRAFAANAGNGLHEVEKAAHAASDAVGSNRMALMELGHSARSIADGLMAGMSPTRILAMETPRIAQAMGEAGIKVASMVPWIAVAAAGVAVLATEWFAVMGGIEDSTKKSQDYVAALDKTAAILEKIRLLSRAGLMSTAAAAEAVNELAGPTKRYRKPDGTFTDKPSEEVPVDSAADYGGLYGGPDTFRPRTRTVHYPEVTQDEKNADVEKRLVPQVSEEQAKAIERLKLLEKEAHNDRMSDVEKEIAANHLAFQKKMDDIKAEAQLAGAPLTVGGVRNPKVDAEAQAAVADLQLAQQNRDAEIRREAASRLAEEEGRIRREAAEAARDEMQRVEDTITADQEREGGLRGQFAEKEYQQRLAALDGLLQNAGLGEEEYTHLVEEATHKRAEAQKEYMAQLATQAQLERDIADAQIRLQMARVQGNNDLSTAEKAAAMEQLYGKQSDLVQVQIKELETQKQTTADAQKRLDIEKKILELKIEQAGLTNKEDKADKSFSGQLGDQWDKLSDKTGNLNGDAAGVLVSPFTGMRQGFDEAITQMMTKGETFKKFMGTVATTIEKSFIQSVANLAADWITSQAMMLAKTAATQAGITAAHAAGTEARVGIHAAGEGQMTLATMLGTIARQAWHLAETIFHGVMVAIRTAAHIAGEIMATAATLAQSLIRATAWLIEAAIGAMSAEASIPIVGPILAIAAAGGIVAAGMGLMHGFAEGGQVFGPGTGTSDSVPAFLSNGEFVVRASAVQRFGIDNLHAINQGNFASTDAGAGAGAGGGGGQNKVTVHTWMDSRAMTEAIQRDSAHEQYIVDVMRRNIHKFRS